MALLKLIGVVVLLLGLVFLGYRSKPYLNGARAAVTIPILGTPAVVVEVQVVVQMLPVREFS